jgi:predicted aspartyl protease
MTQFSSSSRFPYLPIHFIIGTPDSIEYEADLETLVDTGFSGGLAVPRDRIPSSISPDGITIWRLADNTEVQVNSYYGYVTIGKFPPIWTSIITLEDKYLLGRDVTNSFKMILDHGQRIIVEP